MEPPVTIVVIWTVESLVEPSRFGIGDGGYFSGKQGFDDLLLAPNLSNLEPSILGSQENLMPMKTKEYACCILPS